MPSVPRELRLLLSMRGAREGFFAKAVSEAEAHIREHPVTEKGVTRNQLTEDEVYLLQSDSMAQVAELFYTFADGEFREQPGRLRGYLERHKQYFDDWVGALDGDDAPKRKEAAARGLTLDRVKSGQLSQGQIDIIVDEAEAGMIRFDQATFCALLIELMSDETCRKVLVALANGGLITRIGDRNGMKIRSARKLEDLYRQHLASILLGLEEELTL